MEANANAVFCLCSHLCVGEGVVPLEPKEYSALAQKLLSLGKEPADLFELSREELSALTDGDDAFAERLSRLIDRSAALCFELERLEGMGIGVVTRADADYPAALKKKLSALSPPLFYYAGELSLARRRTIGFVGSRTVEQSDLDFTKNAVDAVVSLSFGVVSGGAKGVDTIAGTEALLRGGFSIEYLCDSMLRKMRSSDTVKRLRDGSLLLLSVVKPDAGFNTGVAMMRNRYIYAQSEATVVVRSDLGKGGTWAGAVDNLKHVQCPTLCRDCSCPGNRALIERGAIPIGEHWDGNIPSPAAKEEEPAGQYSLFE